MVALLHGALIAALLRRATPHPSKSGVDSVQLLLLTPTSAPRAVRDNFQLKLSGATAVKILPPMLPSLAGESAQPGGPIASFEGTGSGVDWMAEAHRALQAFEIRTHQPTEDVLISGSPAEEQWWPKGHHRAGDEFKTPTGDWIVWVTSSCYQVARSRLGKDADGAPRPTTCVDEDRPRR